MLLGTPGPYNWRGAVFKNHIRDVLGDIKKWVHSPVEDPIPGSNIIKPKTVNDYYSYLGTVC